MRRIIMLTLAALTMFGGTALADRRDHRGGVYVQPSRSHYTYRQPRYVAPTYYRNTPTYRYAPAYRYARRPIYVQRPVIRYRYFNYYQRPALIVENYAAMPGYYWVAGHWDWNGYEWMWNPGHYEPDPNYQSYDTSYDPNYQSYDTSYDYSTY